MFILEQDRSSRLSPRRKWTKKRGSSEYSLASERTFLPPNYWAGLNCQVYSSGSGCILVVVWIEWIPKCLCFYGCCTPFFFFSIMQASCCCLMLVGNCWTEWRRLQLMMYSQYYRRIFHIGELIQFQRWWDYVRLCVVSPVTQPPPMGCHWIMRTKELTSESRWTLDSWRVFYFLTQRGSAPIQTNPTNFRIKKRKNRKENLSTGSHIRTQRDWLTHQLTAKKKTCSSL